MSLYERDKSGIILFGVAVIFIRCWTWRASHVDCSKARSVNSFTQSERHTPGTGRTSEFTIEVRTDSLLMLLYLLNLSNINDLMIQKAHHVAPLLVVLSVFVVLLVLAVKPCPTLIQVWWRFVGRCRRKC